MSTFNRWVQSDLFDNITTWFTLFIGLWLIYEIAVVLAHRQANTF